MKLSARNQFKGKIVDIQEGAVNGIVKIDIGGGNVMSATISMNAIKELGLAVGGEAYAVVKATSGTGVICSLGIGWAQGGSSLTAVFDEDSHGTAADHAVRFSDLTGEINVEEPIAACSDNTNGILNDCGLAAATADGAGHLAEWTD